MQVSGAFLAPEIDLACWRAPGRSRALPSLLTPWRSFVAPRRSSGKQRRGPALAGRLRRRLAGELRAARGRCLPSSLLGAPSSRRVARRENSAAALRSLAGSAGASLVGETAPAAPALARPSTPARRGWGTGRGPGSAGGRALERLIVRIFQIYPAGILRDHGMPRDGLRAAGSGRKLFHYAAHCANSLSTDPVFADFVHRPAGGPAPAALAQRRW